MCAKNACNAQKNLRYKRYRRLLHKEIHRQSVPVDFCGKIYDSDRENTPIPEREGAAMERISLAT